MFIPSMRRLPWLLVLLALAACGGVHRRPRPP
jgi:hypothetical protein